MYILFFSFEGLNLKIIEIYIDMRENLSRLTTTILVLGTTVIKEGIYKGCNWLELHRCQRRLHAWDMHACHARPLCRRMIATHCITILFFIFFGCWRMIAVIITVFYLAWFCDWLLMIHFWIPFSKKG